MAPIDVELEQRREQIAVKQRNLLKERMTYPQRNTRKAKLNQITREGHQKLSLRSIRQESRCLLAVSVAKNSVRLKLLEGILVSHTQIRVKISNIKFKEERKESPKENF